MSAQETIVSPNGGTFIESLDRNFTHVEIDESNNNAINTTELLEAAQSLTNLFDQLHSVAFAPVKADIMGNVKKIRDRQLETPLDSATLQGLVRKELDAGKHTATEGLVWLNRALDFTNQSLRHNLADDSVELSTSFRQGYAQTLKQYHGFLVKPIFMAAMSATPYRKAFYASLGSDQVVLRKQLDEFVEALGRIVRILNEFLGRKENKW